MNLLKSTQQAGPLAPRGRLRSLCKNRAERGRRAKSTILVDSAFLALYDRSDLRECVDESRNVSGSHLEHRIRIDVEVSVGEAIPSGVHRRPGDPGIHSPRLIGDAVRRFAEDPYR